MPRLSMAMVTFPENAETTMNHQCKTAVPTARLKVVALGFLEVYGEKMQIHLLRTEWTSVKPRG